ncbi:hypothetical protein EYF80_032477 [Liparis tanakae]|uniref:Uncharacterized protein n=1 Tax=Liparis tanakae TaxID=230148 RepID=A0A4Z2GUL1_9TELE|nr:hypothetical protein EYF80_032477 [Liparis tanakae]
MEVCRVREEGVLLEDLLRARTSAIKAKRSVKLQRTGAERKDDMKALHADVYLASPTQTHRRTYPVPAKAVPVFLSLCWERSPVSLSPPRYVTTGMVVVE